MIHLAVLHKRYLQAILEGDKTVESRLTRTRRAPYERAKVGERIYFKERSGPVGAMAIIERVKFCKDLTPDAVMRLKRELNDLVGAEDEYWQSRRDARYATLLWLSDVRATSLGPKAPRLHGLAWVCLPDDAAPAANLSAASLQG